MSYKLAAIKTLSAAAIMYITVVGLYSGYIWPAVSLAPVAASRVASMEPEAPAAIEQRRRTPDLFISPQQERVQSPVAPVETGIKRSGSAVAREEDAKVAQLKEVRSGSQLGRVKSEVSTTAPGAILSQTTQQMIKEESMKKEKGFGNTRDGLN
jgi:hypothetical protein